MEGGNKKIGKKKKTKVGFHMGVGVHFLYPLLACGSDSKRRVNFLVTPVSNEAWACFQLRNNDERDVTNHDLFLQK